MSEWVGVGWVVGGWVEGGKRGVSSQGAFTNFNHELCLVCQFYECDKWNILYMLKKKVLNSWIAPWGMNKVFWLYFTWYVSVKQFHNWLVNLTKTALKKLRILVRKENH